MSSRRLRVVAIAAIALVPAAAVRAAVESCGEVYDEVRRVATGGVGVSAFAPDGEGVQPYDVSPDGRRVVFSGTLGGVSALWTAALDGSSLARLGKGSNARFSPDGRSVAFVDTNAPCPVILVVPSAGGRARRVARCADNPTWSPDSTRIAFVDTRGGWSARRHLAVVGARGGRVRVLTPWVWHGLPMDRPAWATDGSRLAYDADDPVVTRSRTHAYAIGADGTRKTYLGIGIDPAWAPDGGAIAFTRYGRTRGGPAHWALSIVTPAGGLVREVEPAYARLPAWSASRGIAYVGLWRGVEQVFLVVPGSAPRRLTADRVSIDSEITALLWRAEDRSLFYLRELCS